MTNSDLHGPQPGAGVNIVMDSSVDDSVGAVVRITVAVVDGDEVVGVTVVAGDLVAESAVGGKAADVAVVAIVPSVPGDADTT